MKIKDITILRLACAVFIIYYTLISVIWPNTNGLLVPLCGVMLFLILMDIVSMLSIHLSDIVDFPIVCWILFGFSSLVVAPFISANRAYAVDSAMTFLKLAVMCFSMIYIEKKSGNIELLISLMYATSVIYVLYMYLSGNIIGGRLALINANSDANVCLIGIVTASLLISKSKSKLSKILIIISCILMFYVSLMTGSRKSLVCSLFYVMFWIVVDLRTTWKTYKSYTKIAVLALFAVALYLVARYGIPIFQSSTTYFRLTDEYARRSDLGRIDLYSEAWKYFLQNPIFGLGFNQFRLYNSKGMYSHSTYMEILANTGMVGAVLFFAPHIWCLKWLTIIANNADTYNKKRTALLLLVYMISSLILAFGMNQLNNERVLMMYSLMFAYIICERERSIE